MIDNVKEYCSKFIQLTELEKEAIEQNFKPVKIKCDVSHSYFLFILVGQILNPLQSIYSHEHM